MLKLGVISSSHFAIVCLCPRTLYLPRVLEYIKHFDLLPVIVTLKFTLGHLYLFVLPALPPFHLADSSLDLNAVVSLNLPLNYIPIASTSCSYHIL